MTKISTQRPFPPRRCIAVVEKAVASVMTSLRECDGGRNLFPRPVGKLACPASGARPSRSLRGQHSGELIEVAHIAMLEEFIGALRSTLADNTNHRPRAPQHAVRGWVIRRALQRLLFTLCDCGMRSVSHTEPHPYQTYHYTQSHRRPLIGSGLSSLVSPAGAVAKITGLQIPLSGSTAACGRKRVPAETTT